LIHLSIVTVTHHRTEALIAKALSSLQQQTCLDFEWVIINDGCDVATRQAIEALQKTNPPMSIQYFDLDHLQEGFGLAHGRNLGLTYAAHDWVCYLDDDNGFMPTFVEESLHFLTGHPEATCVITQQLRRRDVYVGGQVVKQGSTFLSPTAPCDIRSFLTQQSLFDSNGFIHRRDRQVKWNPDYRVFLDYEYFLRYLSSYGVDGCLIHWQPLVSYIQSSTGVIGSSSYENWATELDAILGDRAEYLALDANSISALEQLSQKYWKKAQQNRKVPAFQSQDKKNF
jgi:glycosyltransferase involved in cell wall biosynthesis